MQRPPELQIFLKLWIQAFVRIDSLDPLKFHKEQLSYHLSSFSLYQHFNFDFFRRLFSIIGRYELFQQKIDRHICFPLKS